MNATTSTWTRRAFLQRTALLAAGAALVGCSDDEAVGPGASAGSAEAAWSVLSAQHVDLVVLDVMLPGMSGIDLCRRITTARPVPVILLTAKVQLGDRQAWSEIDVAGVISKPFDPMTLHSQVADLLGWVGGEVPAPRVGD